MGKGLKQMQQKLKTVDCIIGKSLLYFTIAPVLPLINLFRGSRRKDSTLRTQFRVPSYTDKCKAKHFGLKQERPHRQELAL